MSDVTEIMRSIPPEYKKQKKVNDFLRDTYFFKTWTGYHHPIHMLKPLSYVETQNNPKDYYAYYEASLDTSGNDPKLIFVEKFIVQRQLVVVDERQIDQKKKKNTYFLFHKNKDSVLLDKEISLEETFGIKEYVHVVQDDVGKLTKSEIVKKEFEWSYQYEYDEKGRIMRVTIVNALIDSKERRTRIIERGQQQEF